MKNDKRRIQQRQRPRTKMTTKLALRIGVASAFGLAIAFTILFNFSESKNTMAAATDDFRSKATGNWNSTGTWEKFDGTSWVAADVTPSSSKGVITLQSGFTVTVTANVTVDQVVVDSGAVLTVSSGTLTVANGSGSDLSISGTANLNAGGTVTINSGASTTVLSGGTFNHNGGTRTLTGWTINNGGTYVHNVNGVAIPTATWGASSTLRITGVTSSNISGTFQDFGNLIYDCPSQTCCSGGGTGSTLEFLDGLKTIAGDFTVLSSGTGGTWLQRTTTTTPVTISGNYIQSGGKVFMTKGAGFSWNLMGNFTLSGGTFVLSERYGLPTLNIYGNFSMTGGTFDHSQGNSIIPGEGIGTVNLYGDYSRTSGSHTETATGTGRGEFNFVKTGTQLFTATGGTITNTVNFTVAGTAVLNLADQIITGGGSFTLSSGGGLILGSAAGITSSGASGNIQVTGTRNFGTGGHFTYAGTSAQVTGNGLPATAYNLTFNNANNVTMSGSSSATNLITLTDGKIITNSYELGITNTDAASIAGYSSSRYVVGNLRRGVNGTGSYDFPVGDLTNYELLNVNLTGATGFTNILGLFTNANPIEGGYPLTNIYVGNTPITDMLDYGYWTLSPDAAMSGGTYDVTVYARGHSNSAPSPDEYCILKRNGSGSSWQSLGTHTNSTQSETGGTVTAARTGYNSFSHFGIGKSVGGPLPVKLTTFTGEFNHNTVELQWTTASEINNEYFSVFRSKDGISFEKIGKVQGAGNTTTTQYYAFADESPYDGKSYYRLSQTDFDGTTETHRTISVSNNGNTQQQKAAVYYNRDNSVLSGTFYLDRDENVQVYIFSSGGAVISSSATRGTKGKNNLAVQLGNDLSTGVYYLNIVKSDGTREVCKFLKQ